MASPIVNRAAARKQMIHHQFLPGIGYFAHGSPPDLPPQCVGAKVCAPPEGTVDGSLHVMRPSHGAPDMPMRWVAAEKAWSPLKLGKGNRLAWTADYLSRAGWEYVGPVEGDKPSKRKAR